MFLSEETARVILVKRACHSPGVVGGEFALKAVAGAIVLGVCAAAPAMGTPLEAVSFGATYDFQSRVVHFEIVYNREPDFYTLDPKRRQADSFQIHLDTVSGVNGWGGTSPFPWETIVRGEEIHIEGDIRIRDHLQAPSPKPHSGGWGPIAGSVPYRLDGKTQTFSAPYDMLNTQSGKFAFVLELYNYGTGTGVIYDGSSMEVPAPGPIGLAAASLGWALGRRRRR